MVGGNFELELFERLCNHSNVKEDLFLSCVALSFASVLEFASIHAALCVQAPTDEAISAVVALVNTHHGVVCSGIDVARLRQLAMLCFTALPAAQARQALALGAMPAEIVPSGPAPVPVPEPSARGEAAVAQRQWTAYRFAEQMSSEVPRTRQISDHDVFKWHNDAVRSGSLRHFVDLLKVRNAATCKVETTAVLSDGVHLTLDKSDATPTRALVANCLLNCDMILT